jgi:hypothetical protein
MLLRIKIPQRLINLYAWVLEVVPTPQFIAFFAIFVAVAASTFYYFDDTLIAYGDAESHLNIAKRVVHSMTPGIAQVGGIWLPLPHLLMVPFVFFEPLYRTGLAGAIVSGSAYVISAIYLFKTVELLTRNKFIAFTAALIFILNPNVLYMQATPMTELTLIVFFILSSYYFIRFLYNQANIMHLILAAFFGFCASLSRYDGWFLVIIEAFILYCLYAFNRKQWMKLQGLLVLFCTLAFFGVFLWLAWDYLILGDPFYFTNSQFSAKSQQQSWLSRGELPAYHNLTQSILYYTVTAMSNIGVIVFGLALVGFVMYLKHKENKARYFTALLLLVPFIFYVVTLYLGQSIIFIPSLTPVSFEWRLFNVRYGIMMVPFAAVFCAYLFGQLKYLGRLVIVGLLVFQYALYAVGYSPTVTLADGVEGLSYAKRPDAEYWLKMHYDGGNLLMDDYARTISPVRSGLHMQNVIYIGNKPYWQESLEHPEKHATWIVMQKNDTVWMSLYENPYRRAELFKHYQKVYTSDEILIFRKPL